MTASSQPQQPPHLDKEVDGLAGGRVTRTAFEALRKNRTGVIERLRASGVEARLRGAGIVDTLGEDTSFSKIASWAVWSEPRTDGNGNEIAPVTASQDRSILNWKHLEAQVRHDLVFVALNFGRPHGAPAPTEDWANFHGGTQDYRLSRAIRSGDPSRQHVWGAYMTDFYKYLPTEKEKHLEDLLVGGGVSKINRAMAETLQCELDLLAARDPLLVPIGRKTADVLRQELSSEYDVYPGKFPHYSRAPRDTMYGEVVAELVTYKVRRAS
jgi:hypothetical protein